MILPGSRSGHLDVAHQKPTWDCFKTRLTNFRRSPSKESPSRLRFRCANPFNFSKVFGYVRFHMPWEQNKSDSAVVSTVAAYENVLHESKFFLRQWRHWAVTLSTYRTALVHGINWRMDRVTMCCDRRRERRDSIYSRVLQSKLKYVSLYSILPNRVPYEKIGWWCFRQKKFSPFSRINKVLNFLICKRLSWSPLPL